jgi:hypothetical protein
VFPVMSYVKSDWCDGHLGSAGTCSPAKYDDISGGMSNYARTFQVRAAVP